jgi:hypothetical protein
MYMHSQCAFSVVRKSVIEDEFLSDCTAINTERNTDEVAPANIYCIIKPIYDMYSVNLT